MNAPMNNSALIPPHSLEAEQSILGAMMLDNKLIENVSDLITVSDFYRGDHQDIFKKIIDLDADGKAVDVVTVSEAISSDVTDLAYLGGLAKNTPNLGNVTSYARIVRERSMKRKLIAACQEFSSAAYQDVDKSAHDIVNGLGNAIEGIEAIDTSNKSLHLNQITALALNELEQRFKSKSDLIGLSTGLIDLDHKTAGLCASDLIVVAGRPSMGKTAFAFNLAKQALVGGGVVKAFSMEMPKTQLYNRIWSEESGVHLGKVRQPKKLEDHEWTQLTAAAQRLNDRRLIIDDQAGLNINQIRSRCRKTKREEGRLDMVIVDYLGLMQKSGEGNLTSQIGEITRALKNMAKDLDTVVVLLSQLNRGVDHRPNKRPVMSDLMDSSAIESDADVIMFLYRDEVYNPDTEHKGVCEINIAKQRNGETGRVRCLFRGEVQRFENLSVQYGGAQ